MRSNCLIFALSRIFRRGGYLIIRRSRHLWLPHFLWAPPDGLKDAKVEHFVPLRPTRQPWKIWRAVLFRGRVRRCDRSHCACARGRDCNR